MTVDRLIGRYHVVRQLGRGGFASVHEVVDEALAQPMAMKVLDEAWNLDLETRERFVQEARILRRLSNPALVKVFDIGDTSDGRAWFAMTLADRGSLGDRLADAGGPSQVTPADVEAVATALADGLTALHDADIVHRDITPYNLLLESTNDVTQGRQVIGPDEKLLVADLGLAKDLGAAVNALTGLGGTPKYRAPEQTVLGASIDSRADIYAATAVIWEMVTGLQPPGPHEQRERFEDLYADWQAFMRTGMAANPVDRFDDIASWRDELLGLVEHGVYAIAPSAPEVDVNPYAGLAAYDRASAAFFAGRESLVEGAIRRLRRERSLLIGGPSGAGKSSLMHAGLAPMIDIGAIDPQREWVTAQLTPGDQPVERLLAALIPSTGRPFTVEELGGGLHELASAVDQGDVGLVIMVDQLEELATGDHSIAERSLFLSILEELASHGSTTRVVITLRADFYGAVGPSSWLDSLLSEHLFVGPLERAELRRALERPAIRAGGIIEPSLMATVLDQAAGMSGTLPHVSHIFSVLWDRREGEALTLATYRHLGGLDGALATSAEDFVDSLRPEQVDTLKRLILEMVAPSQDGQIETRRPVALDRLSPPQMELIRGLVDRRLVTVDEDDAQLAHETLISGWPRLASWINETRADLEIAAELRRTAELWEASGRSTELLQRGVVLAGSRDWVDRTRPHLEAHEAEFLEAGTSQERRAGQVRRRVLWSLVGLVLLTSVGAVVAVRQSRLAEASSKLALSRRLAAESATALLQADRDLAGLLALAGDRVSPTVEANRSMFQAVVSDVEGGTELGRHVGDVRAVDTATDGAVVSGGEDGSIRVWVDGIEARTIETAHQGEVRDVAFVGDDSSRLVSIGLDGFVRLWGDGDDGPLAEQALGSISDNATNRGSGNGSSGDGNGSGGNGDTGNRGSGNGSGGDGNGSGSGGSGPGGNTQGEDGAISLRALSVSDDGSRVAVGGQGGIWEWDFEAAPQLLLGSPREVMAVAWNEASDQLAYGDRDGLVQVLRADAATTVTIPRLHDAVVFDVGWDGNDVVSVDRSGGIKIWDVERSEVVATNGRAHDGEIYGLATSGDGRLATGGADRVIRVWNTEDLTLRNLLRGHQGDVRDLAFTTEGDVTSVAADGTVRRWTNSRSDAVVELAGVGSEGVLDLDADGEHRLVVAAFRSGQILIWSLDGDLPTLIEVPAHDDPVTTVELRQDGTILSGANDGRVVLTTIGPGDDVDTRQLNAGEPSVRAVASSPDVPDTVAVADSAGEIYLLDIADRQITPLYTHQDEAFGLAWSPDGSSLVSVGRSGDLVVHRRSDAGWVSETLDSTGSELRAVAFSPDGSLVAAAGAAPSVRLYDPVTGERRVTVAGHEGGVRDLDWSDDGAMLVTVGRDRQVRIRDTETFDLIAAASVHEADTRAVHVGDGVSIITASNAGQVRLWPGPVRWPDAICQMAGRELSDDEWQIYGDPGSATPTLCR